MNTMLNGRTNGCDICCKLAFPNFAVYVGHLGILLNVDWDSVGLGEA